MAQIKRIPLNDGNSIPQIGLGLWLVPDADAARIVREGVAAGYRSFDTAAMYDNETGAGDGIASSGVERKELFIATKLWNSRHGFDETLRAFDESMARLRLEYLDLYLIHWPVAGSEKYIDSWKAFIRLQEEGRVRSIGVSNFLGKHLQRLLDETGVAPALNQIEYHPFFQPRRRVLDNADRWIATECWAPLGRGRAVDNPVLAGIAAKHGKSPAQIVLRWHVEQGRIVIPKTSNPDRMRENLAVFDFALDASEIDAIDALADPAWKTEDPDVFTGLEPR